jgi:signal transduction histidine kinase/CheY-like chemotaxis protein
VKARRVRASARRKRPRAPSVGDLESLRLTNEQLIDAQAILVEERDRYADLYDMAPVGLVALNAAGIIVGLNVRAAEMLKTDRRQAAGLPFAGFTSERRRFRHHLGESKRIDAPAPIQIELQPRQGGPLTVELLIRRAHSGPGLRMALLDVTEGVRLARAERDARVASDAKDAFIAMLSHELRTPLGAAMMAASAVQHRGLAPAKVATLCKMIEESLTIQSRLVDDLLDVTRIVRGKMQLRISPVPLRALVQEVVAMFGPGDLRGTKLTVALEHDESRAVGGDATRLRQVFWNLIKNGLKFTPPGGLVTVRSWTHGQRTAIEVQDTGVGLAPQALERLFRPFEQAEDGAGGGLGLGLAIARGIVELHGGALTAASRGPGQGSRFVVDLPNQPSPPLPVASGTAKAPTAGRRESAGPRPRMLLVEDNLATAKALSLALRAEGYAVTVASTVAEALRVDLAQVSIVVSDIGLPDGDGLSLLQQLRQKRKVRAIALSGYGTERDVQASLDAGFTTHLVKPITLPDLVAAIDRALLQPVPE